MGKGKITAIKNGPFQVRQVKKIIKSNGEELKCTKDLMLCRCGASANKPYCDSTHVKNGFVGLNRDKHIRNKTIAYQGKEITIYDNRNICSHAGYCTAGLPAVFSSDRPWINPDGDAVDKIIAICNKCPSGALSYSLKDGERNFGREYDMATIRVVGRQHQGPYVITGSITIEGQMERLPEAPAKMTLCRCGQSKNKPYCNGDHRFLAEAETEEA